jgi:hypothetical protein
VRLSRILRDYQDAGGVNELIALWGFVDDGTFLTKRGHVGLVYRVRGVDAEGLTHAQRAAFVHRMEAALRLLDERCRVYQYVIKRTADPFVSEPCSQPVANEAIQRRTAFLNARREHLYTFELYLAVVYEPAMSSRTSTRLHRFWHSPKAAIGKWLSRERAIELIEIEINEAVTNLHQIAHAFETQLSDVGLSRFGKHEAFRFFRRLMNYDAAAVGAATLTGDTHLDYFIADSAIDCHRDHLTIGNRMVKVLSMKEPPAHTFAHLLGDVYAVPGEFVACLEWQRLASDRVRRDLQSRRRHFFNKRVSIVNYVSPENARAEPWHQQRLAIRAVRRVIQSRLRY